MIVTFNINSQKKQQEDRCFLFDITPGTNVHYFQTGHVLEDLSRDFFEAVPAKDSKTQINRYHHSYVDSMR